MAGDDPGDPRAPRRVVRGAPRFPMRRLVVAFCVASIVGACESATAPSLTVQKVSGSYALAEVDGHQLPYLSQTEPGDTIRSTA